MIHELFSLSPALRNAGAQAEEDCREAFSRIEQIAARNTQKVLYSFWKTEYPKVILPVLPAMDMTTGAGTYWIRSTPKLLVRRMLWCATILFPAPML